MHACRNPDRVCRKKRYSLCLCETLRVSVVKLFEKTFTTGAQRSHRGTEISFSDRLNERHDWSASVPLAADGNRDGCAPVNQASAGNDSEINSGVFRPPIHLRIESIKTITAAVMISAVSEVLM